MSWKLSDYFGVTARRVAVRSRPSTLKLIILAIINLTIGFTIAYATLHRNKPIAAEMALSPPSSSDFLVLFGFVFLSSIVGGFLLLRYLRPSASLPNESRSESNLIRSEIKKETEAFLDEFLNNKFDKTVSFSNEDKSQILASIENKLESEAMQSYLSNLSNNLLIDLKKETFTEQFYHTRHRLNGLVLDLAKRGNLNLILGITTTLFGIGILGYAVFTSPLVSETPLILAYFIPKLSLVLLIEVFAYFFLKLYKQSHAEIKYFHNEITNVEGKELAFAVAIQSDDPSLRAKVVEALVATERNFILTKDQTTLDLERERIATHQFISIAESIKELVKKKD